MRKLIFTFLLVAVSLFSFTTSNAENSPYTVDFSNVKLVVADNVNWNFYNRWFLGYEGKVDTAPFSGWTGERLEDLTKAPYVDYAGMSGNYFTVQHVGLTKDAGVTFAPTMPSSCAVKLKAGDTLHVYGTLYILGNGQEPYIENLSCQLN